MALTNLDKVRDGTGREGSSALSIQPFDDEYPSFGVQPNSRHFDMPKQVEVSNNYFSILQFTQNVFDRRIIITFYWRNETFFTYICLYVYRQYCICVCYIILHTCLLHSIVYVC